MTNWKMVVGNLPDEAAILIVLCLYEVVLSDANSPRGSLLRRQSDVLLSGLKALDRRVIIAESY